MDPRTSTLAPRALSWAGVRRIGTVPTELESPADQGGHRG